MVFHFLLFCYSCRIWNLAKINYVFVFEFDTRHVLDWCQLAEVSLIPSPVLLLPSQWLIYGAVALFLCASARIVSLDKFPMDYRGIQLLADFFDCPDSYNIIPSCSDDLLSKQEMVCIFQCTFWPSVPCTIC